MRTHLTSMLALAGFLTMGAFTGCGAPVESEAVDEATADISRGDAVYVTLRRDLRRCLAPRCGGYFITHVNQRGVEHYVSDLRVAGDITGSGEALLTDVRDAPDGEVVLHGYLGPAELRFETRRFMVLEAWRGMPGIVPAGKDVYYAVTSRESTRGCTFGPCFPIAAERLNTLGVQHPTGIDVTHAAAPHVDDAWLGDRVLHHGALVTGVVQGPEKILDASQVFVRLPEQPGPCFLVHVLCKAPLVPAFTRDDNRCRVFDACIDPNACMRSIRPIFECREGYTPVAWTADNARCLDYACDPTFAVP